MTAPGPTSGAPGGPPVGSLAAEAAQLLDALAARLAQVRVTVGEHASADQPPASDDVHDSSHLTPEGLDPHGLDPHGLDPDGLDPDGLDPDVPDDLYPDPAADRVEPAAGHRECVGWCPVCRSADLLRGERPEVAGKLVDSAIVVINALRSLLPDTDAAEPDAGQSRPADPGPTAAGRPGSGIPAAGGPGGGPPRPPGIERIDIR